MMETVTLPFTTRKQLDLVPG